MLVVSELVPGMMLDPTPLDPGTTDDLVPFPVGYGADSDDGELG